MRLGELLIKEGEVTQEHVSEALRAQVIYGGRIGTNLIELGHAHIDAVAEALGHQHHLACAHVRHFDDADKALQMKLSPVLAMELNAIPLSEQLPGVIAIAFLDPPLPDAVDKITDALKCEIVPVIAPELRLRYQLEQVYGITRPSRYVRIGRKTSQERTIDGESERRKRRYVHTLSDVEPEAGTLGRVQLQRKEVRREGKSSAASDNIQIDEAATLEDALVSMRRATDRDRVVDLMISCVRHAFGRRLGVGLMLVVREDTAIGWRGFSDHSDDSVASAVAIPLDEPSVLQLSYKTGVLVCGKPPPAGELIDNRLWKLLGSQPPQECIVAPVRIQDHVVCMLYAHAGDLGPIGLDLSHDVGELAHGAGSAFARLIRSHGR